MKNDDISLEVEELFRNARPLSEIDLDALAEANQALSRNPKHVASVMKGVFVNDVLCAMKEQGLNKSQVALNWGKSRQYLNSVLNRNSPGNFTLDTIVSLSMSMGLRPQCIKLEPMEAVKAQVTATSNKAEVEAVSDVDWCNDPECPCAEPLVAADELKALAA